MDFLALLVGCFREGGQPVLSIQYITFDPPEDGLPWISRISYSDWSHGHNHILHCHEDTAEILLILHGRGSYTVGLHRAEVEAGDVVLTGCGVPHDEFPQTNELYQTLCLGICGLVLPGREAGKFVEASRSPVFHRPAQFLELAALGGIIRRHGEARQAYDDVLCQHAARSVLALAAQMTAEAEGQPLSGQAVLIARLEDYIGGHYTEDLTIDRLSRKFYISPYYLSHLFKERTGYSLKQYILRRRIGEAQTRLYTTRDSVQQIAADMGFEDAAYFSRIFTKYVGLPPVEYRKLMNVTL